MKKINEEVIEGYSIKQLKKYFSMKRYKHGQIIRSNSSIGPFILTEISYEKRPEGTVMRIEGYKEEGFRAHKYAIRVNLATLKNIVISSSKVEFEVIPYYTGKTEHEKIIFTR